MECRVLVCAKCNTDLTTHTDVVNTTLSGKPITNCKECNSMLKNEDKETKLTDNSLISSLLKLHSTRKEKEVLLCSSCNKRLNSSDEYIATVHVGGYENYCNECHTKKMRALKALIPPSPIITLSAGLILIGVSIICLVFLTHKDLWIVSPIIFLAISIDVYNFLDKYIGRKRINKITEHYMQYGTYDTIDVKEQSCAEMLASIEAKEDVSHLEHFMDEREKLATTSKLNNLIYDILIILKKINNTIKLSQTNSICLFVVSWIIFTFL